MKYLLALFSLAFACSTWGQDWYEIEVLIFEHESNQHENLSDPERWPSDLNLEWPSLLMELNPVEEDTGDNNSETETAPTPYAELPTDQQRLGNANYAMRVRDGYRLLWHKSWKAPMLPEEESPWILIQADDQIGDHYRLEGAIRVHLTRYLHLHSNLWLTELLPMDSEDQTEFHWSQLPTPEIARWPCIFVEEDWPEAARELPDDYFEKPAPDDWYYPFGCGVEPGDDTDGEETRDFPTALPMELMAPTEILGSINETDTTDSGDSSEESSGNQKPNFFGLELFDAADQTDPDSAAAPTLTNRPEDQARQGDDLTLEEGYPVKEIVHIQSRRRMRSEELHYIDHPRIGILTIIHPVEQPILEAEPIKYISAPLPSTSVVQPSEDTTE